jgi:5-methyltetrahydrofolate--homocysteine methyltransferase
MAHALIEQLTARAPVATDGAWGTQLQVRGLQPGASAEAWNLERPDQVESVARAYVEAGSQIILTNTFGANRLALERHGLADQLGPINRRGVEISRQAAGRRARVFASMGPSGRMLMTGEVSQAELEAAFAEQALALAEGGADAIAVETMTDAEEAKIAVAAARQTGLPVVACMVFDSGPDRDRTLMGLTPEQAAETLAAAGADVVGANCGQGIPGFVPVCRRLRAASGLPVWIKANAGLPEVLDGRIVYRTSPGEFAAWVPALLEAGASFIGGCCGTSPDFIRAVTTALPAGERSDPSR